MDTWIHGDVAKKLPRPLAGFRFQPASQVSILSILSKFCVVHYLSNLIIKNLDKSKSLDVVELSHLSPPKNQRPNNSMRHNLVIRNYFYKTSITDPPQELSKKFPIDAGTVPPATLLTYRPKSD
jgi:hypothetical protein